MEIFAGKGGKRCSSKNWIKVAFSALKNPESAKTTLEEAKKKTLVLVRSNGMIGGEREGCSCQILWKDYWKDYCLKLKEASFWKWKGQNKIKK